MTTDDFNELLKSMEGQFQINLARPWAHESDQGGIQRLLAEDAITVKNEILKEDVNGLINPNSDNKTLSTICSYIQCTGTTHQCVDSFIPFGHCCPVCGTRIELVAFELNFEKAKRIVINVLSEMEPNAEVFATFERKTEVWGNSMYEIAIISSDNITLDEDFHKKAANLIILRLSINLRNEHHATILDTKVFHSKLDRTIKTLSKVVACIIYFTILIVLAGLFAYKNVEMRMARQEMFKPVIKYRRSNDDVAIEMGGIEEIVEEVEEDAGKDSEIVTTQPVHPPEDKDDVEDWRNINPNFDLPESEGMEFEMTETVKKTTSEDEPKERVVFESDEKEDVAEENEKSEDEDVANPLFINPNYFENDSDEEKSDDAIKFEEDVETQKQDVLKEKNVGLEEENVKVEQEDVTTPEDVDDPFLINPNFNNSNDQESDGVVEIVEEIAKEEDDNVEKETPEVIAISEDVTTSEFQNPNFVDDASEEIDLN